MFMLFDFECIDPNCLHRFEDLVSPEELPPLCPVCHAHSVKMDVCNQNTVEHNPAQREIMSKSVHMRKRLQKKLPWRKSSYSQTGNE